MVFRKYRAVKQWGKMDTRIFKEIYNSRNKRKMPAFEIPEAVKALGVRVHEPNELFRTRGAQDFEKDGEILKSPGFTEFAQTEHRQMKMPEEHDREAYVFEGKEPMSDGIAQAALLSRSIVRNGLPEAILHNSGAKLDVDEEMVRDAILHGERYDPTLEKLPARFDPVMFWIRHVRLHGTPVIKRNNIILDNLLRQVLFAGLRTSAFTQNLQINRDAYMSVKLDGGNFFSKAPFILRAQPHLTVQSLQTGPVQPWAGPLDVQAASVEPLPDIYPICPTIDLYRDTIYHDETLLTRKSQPTNIHSLLWAREQDQKYPWTTEQNMANAILTTYAGAVAQATRNGQKELEKPVLVRGVQLVNGRLDLVAFQLNTLNIAGHGEDVKNIVWIEKGLRLYKPKPYYEPMEVVEKLDMNVFRKFCALMLGFDAVHAH